MVPKYFSLNWQFLSHSPSRRQGELFHFLAFSLLEHRSLFIVFMVAFCSAIPTSIFLLFCFSLLFFFFFFLVFVFLLVFLLLILLRHSFLSLDFCLFVFPPVFSSFLRSMFFSSCLSYLPPVFSFSFVSFCGSPYLVLMYLLSFVFFLYLVWMFLLCVFSSLLLFLIFCVFFSPGPRVRLKRITMEKQLSHFVCLSGIFAKMSFAQNYCLFFILWILFVHRTCVC